jgi:hypothetical protein
VIDAGKTVPGVLDAYHLVNPATGNGLSIAFFEDTVNVADVKAAIGKKSTRSGRTMSRAPLPSPRPPTRYFAADKLRAVPTL